ncbi:MAG: 50S ribosomal protein L24 [bacterium]|nr:50S ribosomal protein L24 [bacterium]
MKIHKGDTVLIISGKDKGRVAKILRSLPKEGKILVDGINLKNKHIKPKKQGEKGQVIGVPAPLDASDVKIVCPKCNKAARVGYKLQDGKKFRICKKCKAEI